MILAKKSVLGPGEARTRTRQRRQMIFLGVSVVIGGTIGGLTGAFDQGDGSLFSGDWDKLKLNPAIAVLVSALLVIGFIALPLRGFGQIDEFKRENNFIGFTGGCLAVLAGFPIWAVLYAGGMLPPPHAFGIWLLGFFGMFASYLIARIRA
ncbi:hypothetical protein SOQ14_11940 [Erythrobacter sp. T5W1-R]|uniref:hypothetical protein n=1 Tax=Erythrobacter sp. T5W1-R TaxID=3101752 RepID=UPI002AFDFE4B|nr:hypothetical protein [Erythrobacter sp. T5W1-R]MEA1619629.1 hypothetical protein [Erythrobacter sp. T5W1-R]